MGKRRKQDIKRIPEVVLRGLLETQKGRDRLISKERNWPRWRMESDLLPRYLGVEMSSLYKEEGLKVKIGGLINSRPKSGVTYS